MSPTTVGREELGTRLQDGAQFERKFQYKETLYNGLEINYCNLGKREKNTNNLSHDLELQILFSSTLSSLFSFTLSSLEDRLSSKKTQLRKEKKGK